MYSTLKTTTLERKFPLLAVEQGCIVSKEADITVAFVSNCRNCSPLRARITKPCTRHEQRQSAYYRILRSYINRTGCDMMSCK